VSGVPPPKVVAPPPGDAVWSDDLWKIIEIVATRSQILRFLNASNSPFRLGLRLRPHAVEELPALPRVPRLLSCI